MTAYVYEVSAPFRTPEIDLLPNDVLIWNPSRIMAIQDRGGVVTHTELPQYFGAQILAHDERLRIRASIRQMPSLALAVGDSARRPGSLRRLSPPRHLVAL